jgi:hypothetical protein
MLPSFNGLVAAALALAIIVQAAPGEYFHEHHQIHLPLNHKANGGGGSAQHPHADE